MLRGSPHRRLANNLAHDIRTRYRASPTRFYTLTQRQPAYDARGEGVIRIIGEDVRSRIKIVSDLLDFHVS
jgi:hypothetical protein